jgi:outer membrane lipopolysaccharide assembly protein LptE/RlpB
MGWHKLFFMLLIVAVSTTSCFRYSFTGTSIPEGVNTVYIPFFPDQSNSGLGDLSDRLNLALIERFVNQSRLQLASSESDADAILDGRIISYSNRPFSIGGDAQANQNQVQISVSATFQYTSEESALWSNKSFSGSYTYDPTEDPVNGEETAADEALQLIANNMFNDAVSSW